MSGLYWTHTLVTMYMHLYVSPCASLSPISLSYRTLSLGDAYQREIRPTFVYWACTQFISWFIISGPIFQNVFILTLHPLSRSADTGLISCLSAPYQFLSLYQLKWGFVDLWQLYLIGTLVELAYCWESYQLWRFLIFVISCGESILSITELLTST